MLVFLIILILCIVVPPLGLSLLALWALWYFLIGPIVMRRLFD
jgi:hypothetical protein